MLAGSGAAQSVVSRASAVALEGRRLDGTSFGRHSRTGNPLQNKYRKSAQRYSLNHGDRRGSTNAAANHRASLVGRIKSPPPRPRRVSHQYYEAFDSGASEEATNGLTFMDGRKRVHNHKSKTRTDRMSGSAHRYKVHTDSVASSHSPSLQDHVHLPGHLEEDEGQSLMTSVHKHHYQGNRNRFPAPQHHTKRNAGRNSTSADDGNQKPSKINGGNAHDDGDDYDHGSDDGDGTISKSETSSMRSRAQKGTENPYRFSMAQYDPQHYKPTYNNESLTVQRVRDMVEHIENMQAKRQKCVMHPMSPYTAKWDIFVLLLLMFTAIVTPYEIAFFDVELNGLFIVNRIVDLGFLLDMIFRFYRGYVDFNGAYVFDRNLIRRRYTERWFWLDLVSLVPYDLVGYSLESSNVTHLKTLRLLRLIRLSKLMNFVRGFSVIKRWQSEFGIRHAAVSLVQFGIALMLVSHWGACIWAMVPVIEEADEDSESWMSAYNVHEASAGEQYMAALYWSSMTVTTIGYGDVSPKTTGERIVAVICMFVGGAIYAYIIGHVCGLVASMDETSILFYKTMDHLNVYMEVLSLPHDMRVRFRRYFMQCKDVFEHDFHKSVMARMSPGLRGEFANFVHRKWISRVSFFCKSPSESHGFVTDLAMCFQVQAYPAGECIVQLNEYAECMYIIQRGLAARLGKIMSKGKVFGEDIILTDGIRHYTVRSLTFVNCLMMTKGDLTAILSSGKFPETSAIIRRAAVKLAIRREFIAYASAIAALGIRGASNSLHKSKTYSMGLSTSGSQRRPSSFPFHNQMTELWERSNTLNAQQMNEISSVSEEQEEGAKNSARTEDPDTNTARESDVGPSDSSRAVEMMQFTKESNDSVQGKQYTNEAHTHFTTYANSKTAFGNAAIASEGSDEGKHYAFREVDSTYNTRNGDKHKRKQPIANPRYSLNPSLSPHYHTSNELLLEVLANQEEIKNSIESSVGEMQRQIVSVKSVVNDLLHHVVAGVSKSEASMAAEFRRDRRASFYKYHSTMGMPVTGKGGYPQSLSRDRQGKRERGRERNQDRGRYNRRSLSEPRNRDRYRQDHHYSDNSPPLSRHNHEQRDDNNRRHQHQYHPHNEEPSQYGNNRLYDNANNYVGHNQYTDYDNHRHQQEHYYHRPPNQTSDFRNRYDSNHKYEHSSHHNDSLHHHLRQQVHAQSDIRHMAQSAPSSLPPHASHASHALQHDTLAPPPIARVLGLHTPEKIDSLRHVTPTTATTSKSTPTHTPLVFPLRRQASNVAAQDNDNELLTTGLSLPLTFTLQTRTQAVEAERRKGNIIK